MAAAISAESVLFLFSPRVKLLKKRNGLYLGRETPPKGAAAAAVYSELAVARGSPPPLVFDGDPRAGRGVGKLYGGEMKGEASGVS